jgi:DNA-binding MarR family transcriptional regulator
VDAHVGTGFVVREPHPADRRATLVSFTEHGARIGAALARDHAEFARLLFADMPDEQFRGFVAGLDHVLARLREHGISLDHEERA